MVPLIRNYCNSFPFFFFVRTEAAVKVSDFRNVLTRVVFQIFEVILELNILLYLHPICWINIC